MGLRSETLASQFEQANRELIATVDGCSDAQWKATTSGETWSVGVVAHHVAQGHQGIAGLIKAAATGQAGPSLTMDMIHKGNAEHAKEHANCTKADTVALLRTNGSAAATSVRGLSDEQLERSKETPAGAMTVQQMIERILIGHVKGHHESIQSAVKGK
jgi:uncharacterized damage-inducible protein DinB